MNEAERLVSLLTERKLTVAAAESCTGGLVAAAITSVPGASAVLAFSAVTYADAAKIGIGVQKETIARYGAVSEQTAKEMAESIRRVARADLGLSVTGVAGPSPSEGKPVGLVYLGISFGEKTEEKKLMLGTRTREEIRQTAVQELLSAAADTVVREGVRHEGEKSISD